MREGAELVEEGWGEGGLHEGLEPPAEAGEGALHDGGHLLHEALLPLRLLGLLGLLGVGVRLSTRRGGAGQEAR